jgi:hypothetical protein
VAINGQTVQGVADGGLESLAEQGLCNGRIGRQNADGGRHIRADHPGAFGSAGQRDRFSADLDGAVRLLGTVVGGHNSLGKVQSGRGAVAEQFAGLLNARRDLGNRKRVTDDAGRGQQNTFGIDFQFLADLGTHHLGRGQTFCSGAGIGVTAVNDCRIDRMTGDVLFADEDGC